MVKVGLIAGWVKPRGLVETSEIKRSLMRLIGRDSRR